MMGALNAFIEKFKKVMSIGEWKKTAQEAMAKKQFTLKALDELHRVERAEREGMTQSMNRGMQQGYGQQMGYPGGNRGYQDPRQMTQNSYMGANAAYQNQSYGQPYGVPQGGQPQQKREPLSKLLQRVRESQSY